MTIRGSLEEASLPDFLQLLSLGRKTGRLAVSDQPHLGYIYLDTGRIASATLVNRPDRLGDILVKNGEITASQLDAAIETQGRDRTRKVGAILIEQGVLTGAVLERYVRRQIEEAIYFLLTWQHGEVMFERDLAPESDEILVSIDPDRILLEGARRTDEWTVIEQEIPSLDAVFVLDRDKLESAEVPQTDELRRIVALLDGTRNANQIIDDTGLSPFEVGKGLYDLVTAGCAQPMRRPSGEASRPGAAENEEAGASPSAHFDFAELERYLAQAGEFAEESARKQAAQHIVDCRACTTRLSKVHQRRTGASRAAATGQTAAATAPTLPVTPSSPPVPEEPVELAHHLRDAEMERYVRREGEFARESTRREVGRHIADCPECAARVRKIQRASQAAPVAAERPSVSEAATVPAPAVAARAEHLDDDELRRYARREAEFADAQRRKRAGLHIADCRSCAERLKALDRKRKSVTQATPPSVATTEAVTPVPTPAPAAPAPPPEPAPEPTEVVPAVVASAPPSPPAPDSVLAAAPAPESAPDPPVEAEAPAPLDEPHFNYAKLRAYAERTSEFADDETRRYARRHIMDCEECLADLRRVRRDLREAGGSSALRAGGDRRIGDDRRGGDRRKAPRRGRPDRRVSDTPRRPDRRVMFRRVQTDRRIADRRSLSRRAPEAPALSLSGTRPAARVSTVQAPASGTGGTPLSTPVEPPPRRTTTPAERPDVTRAPAGASAAPPAEVRTGAASEGGTPPRDAAAVGAIDAPLERDRGPGGAGPAAVPAGTDRPKRLEEIVGEPIPPPPPPPAPSVIRPSRPRVVARPAPAPSPAPSKIRWGRIAAIVVFMALAGSAGWFGRSLLDFARPDAPASVTAPAVGVAADLPSDAPDAPAVPPRDSVPATVLAAAPPAYPGRADTVVPPPPSRPPTTVSPSRPRSEPPPRPPTWAAAETRATPPPDRQPESRPEPVVVPPAASPAPPPAPTTTTVSGVVLDPGGAPIAGARVRLADQNVEVRTDAAGSYRLDSLSPGAGTVTVELSGYAPAQRAVRLTAGDSVLVDLMLRPTPRPTATEPDDELASGQWSPADAAAAERVLGTSFPTVEGLWVEGIAVTTGRRPRIRITQLTETGERVALVISRPRPQDPVGTPRVTAVRVIAGTDAYPVTTGTASFGTLLVTAKTSLPADSLQAILGRLQVAAPAGG